MTDSIQNKMAKLDNETAEKLTELFYEVVNDCNYHDEDFIENSCINNYTYWKKEWRMGDTAEIVFDFQIKKGKNDYDFCSVYYKPNGSCNLDDDCEIQSYNQKHQNCNLIKYNIYYCDNDDVYLVKPDSYQDKLFQRIIDDTDNDMNLSLVDVDNIFEEYRCM